MGCEVRRFSELLRRRRSTLGTLWVGSNRKLKPSRSSTPKSSPWAILWESAARYDAGWWIPLLLLRRLPKIGAEWVGEGVSRLASDSAYGFSEGNATWGVGVKLSGSRMGGV